MYGKLIEGCIVYAPNTITVDNITYIPAPDEILESNGYKLIVMTNPPSDPSIDHHWESSWVETEVNIVQTWTEVEDDTTPTERRENAYKTRKIIEYNDSLFTVDEARNLCFEYQYDGTERAAAIIAELSGKIAVAKQIIRNEYPNEGAE